MKKHFLFIMLSFFFFACNEASLPGENSSFQGAPENVFSLLTQQKAISNTGESVSVETGYKSNGSTIAPPTNFSVSQCVFMVSPTSFDGGALSVSAFVSSSGLVTCEQVTRESVENTPTTEDCIAAYTMICVK